MGSSNSKQADGVISNPVTPSTNSNTGVPPNKSIWNNWFNPQPEPKNPNVSGGGKKRKSKNQKKTRKTRKNSKYG